MASEQFAVANRQLGRLLQSGSVAGLNEGQLLDRFLTKRDDAAFEAIVARHGPMVQGVCRGILRDPNDVDDAFQATFLVLVRKAADLRHQEVIANWLYGVAFRVARRAREQAMKRSHADATEIDPADSRTVPLDDFDLRPLIHEELNRLPETYRAALVLCYLEGQTHEAAATQLGWPIGTVKGRLARAKGLLRARLTRRGIAVSTAGLAVALAKETRAAVPDALVQTTTTSALSAATAGLAASTISPHIASLAGGVLQTMAPMKLKYIAMLAVAGLLSASGVSAYQAKPQPVAPTSSKSASNTAPVEQKPRELLRAEEKLRLIDQAFETFEEEKATGQLFGSWQQHYDSWTERRKKALLDLEKIHQQLEGLDFQLNEARRQLESARRTEERLKRSSLKVNISESDHFNTKFAILEAEETLERAIEARKTQRLSEASGTQKTSAAKEDRATSEKTAVALVAAEDALKRSLEFRKEQSSAESQARTEAILKGASGENPPPASKAAGASAARYPQDIERNKRIEEVLEQSLTMAFPNPTPLEDILKYTKQNTMSEELNFPSGIPIYVNPSGLSKSEKTTKSEVSLEIEGLPLRTTLRLILEQLDLDYEVHDGVLEINAASEFANRKKKKEYEEAQKPGKIEGSAGAKGGMGGFQ